MAELQKKYEEMEVGAKELDMNAHHKEELHMIDHRVENYLSEVASNSNFVYLSSCVLIFLC